MNIRLDLYHFIHSKVLEYFKGVYEVSQLIVLFTFLGEFHVDGKV
jgi:hypothetical protein